MPTFPTYHGPPLPIVLNPLNPLHYLIVLKWVFFQPSRLKHYLYQTDPELYRARGVRAMLNTLRLPAYRNLYVIVLIASLLVAIGVVCVASGVQATLTKWANLLANWALIVAIVMVDGVAGGVVGSVAGGVATSVELGVRLGVVAGVGVVGMAVKVGLPDTVVSDVAFTIVLIITLGIAVGMVGGMVSGAAFGLRFGIVGGRVGGMVGTWVGGVVGTWVGGMVGYIAGGVVGGVSVLRHLFYPFELIWTWLLTRLTRDPLRRLSWHPAVWDELSVWPLPGLSAALQDTYAVDLDAALTFTALVMRNPSQRWIAQRVASDWLMAQSDPLEALYQLAENPALNEYLFPPTALDEFRFFPAVRVVLLAKIAQVFTSSRNIENNESTFERLVWRAAHRLRHLRPTPVSQLAVVLHELARTEENLKDMALIEIKLAERFETYYGAVCTLSRGAEVVSSFATLDAALKVQTIADIAQVASKFVWPIAVGGIPVRLAIVEACRALADVSAQVVVVECSTNFNQQKTVLNRAAGALKELVEYIEAKVQTPERVLLRRAAQHWQSIVAEAQGQLGATVLNQMSVQLRQASGLDVPRQSKVWQHPASLLPNPYVAGKSVTGSLFVGRADILNRIGEVWSAKAHPDSIILYGHRRMGKTSILCNIAQAARPPNSVIVYVDLAGQNSLVKSTADLLLGLATKLHADVQQAYPDRALTPPDSAAFTSASKAQLHFDQLVEQVRKVMNGAAIILVLDEFEAIDKAVAEHRIDTGIYQFLRTKTQDPLFTFVLGGLHTLDEMSRDYQQPFYGSYDNIRVSYLSHAEAWRLINNPTPDFDLIYEPAAAERIIAETGGQPYLVQLICRDAIDHLNHELFDEHKKREKTILLSDVEVVLGPDFFARGTTYFDGIWTQAGAPAQRQLLRAMAQRDEAWTLADLEQATNLASDLLIDQLRWMERHDILKKIDADPLQWKFHVPLMRRWIKEVAA